MNKILPLITIAGALLCGVPCGFGQTPQRSDPFVKERGEAAAKGSAAVTGGQVLGYQTVFEVYSMAGEGAFALLQEEMKSAALYQRVQGLEKEGRARLEVLQSVASVGGERVVVQSVDEVRYPTEYDAPRAAGLSAFPTAFEMRAVGEAFEMELSAGSDERSVNVTMNPRSVRFGGFREEALKPGLLPWAQPLFGVEELQVSALIPVGEPHFVGTLSADAGALGGAQREMRLGFLTVHAVRAGTGKSGVTGGAVPAGGWKVQYTFCSMDRALGRDLFKGAGIADAAWEQVRTLMEEGRARIDDMVVADASSGQRVGSSGFSEVHYPTEFTPPDSGEKNSEDNDQSRGGRGEVVEEAGKKDAASGRGKAVATGKAKSVSGVNGWGAAWASRFETRNVGVRVEFELEVEGDGGIVVAQNLSSVVHRGSLKVEGVAMEWPAQPLFESRELKCRQRAAVGQQTLVGTLSAPVGSGVDGRKDEGRAVLVFVRFLNEAR